MIKLHHSTLLLCLLPLATFAQTAPDTSSANAEAQVAESHAVTAPAPEAAAVPAATTATAAAPQAATGALIGPAPADKGQVVFFRPKGGPGGLVGFIVREGETELGKLRSGKYFVATVEPGAHEYVVHSEAKDVLNLEVEAGETYYVQGSISMGLLVGRPNLSPSDETAFNKAAPKMKVADKLEK